jgi:hypothetical protein
VKVLKTITIELTEKQEKFLKEFALKQGPDSKDNVGTDRPISEAYAMDRFVDVTGEEWVIVDEDDYFEAYGIEKQKYCKVHTAYYYETVAVFFILDEARNYLKYQGHNLTNPRTYTIGAGYANKGEYHHFWELLFSIGQQLNTTDTEGGAA